ncbi:MAG: T9SS type A sorting domain-containing protein [Ignavibacteriaceae bacterium]|nr:T9SS type A sorting domain-containing protein [Ignavibacteriaceae bacterium]HRP93111.1 T9SS type A sorting domain-containing protein [Ignavibacteriaceae bacterium]
MQIKITDIFNSEIDKELKPGEELIIHNKQINKLIVQSSPSNAIVTYSLDQNYPNPFNPTTKISWQSPADGKQTLKVFDVLGNEVAVLVDEFRAAGRYEATFNAGNLASGIYIYRLQAGEFIQTKKMIFMK